MFIELCVGCDIATGGDVTLLECATKMLFRNPVLPVAVEVTRGFCVFETDDVTDDVTGV